MKLLAYTGMVTAALLLGGCSWHGYVYPEKSDFQQVSNNDDAYGLGTQNFDQSSDIGQMRLQATMQAIREVQRIYWDPRFAQMMSERTWAVGCDTDPIEQVDGSEVVADLRALDANISVFPKKPFWAEGQTDLANYRIAINPSRMDAFNRDEIVAASELINTVAHELTHMVKLNGQDGVYKYRDAGHGKENCMDDDLVSYRVGRTAQAIWIADNVPPEPAE